MSPRAHTLATTLAGAALFTCAATAAAQTPRDTGTTIIHAGRLFDSEQGTFVGPRDIRVRNRVIEAVGERLEVPPGASEIDLVPLLEAGAAGYLVKSVADRELVDAVRAVGKGDVYVRPTAARVLAKGLTRKDPHQVDRERFEKLTERERDVLRLTA